MSSRLGNFVESDAALLLGLVEDAAKGVSWQTPYPPGSESIVAIAHWLIPHFSDCRTKEQLKRTLSVIAQLPKFDEAGFRSMLAKKDRQSIGYRDQVSGTFREMILSGLEGNAACRDLPDAVIDSTRDCMFMSEEHLLKSRGFGFSSMELEPGFGIQRLCDTMHFPRVRIKDLSFSYSATTSPSPSDLRLSFSIIAPSGTAAGAYQCSTSSRHSRSA